MKINNFRISKNNIKKLVSFHIKTILFNTLYKYIKIIKNIVHNTFVIFKFTFYKLSIMFSFKEILKEKINFNEGKISEKN